METRGVRRFLQPALYVGLAALAHALLFLIPAGSGKREAGQTRGVRLRVVGETLGTAPPGVPFRPVPARPAAEENDSRPGGAPGPGRGLRTDPSEPSAGGGGSPGQGPGGPGAPPAASEFGSYLARLKSEGVQEWAKDSAGQMRQGWRGSGKAGAGWGAGTGSGDGSGRGGVGSGGGYMDPRVQMVVTSYPPTEIEKRHTVVPYPELKVKKNRFTSGWWNVYIQMHTDADGNVVRSRVLRPETDGALERVFVEQVKVEIAKWSFDRKAAEINVDVRFYVE